MADYHFVHKDVPGTTTQWDDIQRRLGNLPPLPERPKPAPWEPSSDEGAPRDAAAVARLDEEELEELHDELDADDRFLEQYRQQRLNELREAHRKPRFSSVEQIKASEFIEKVSRVQDVHVVVHLFKDSITECGIMSRCLEKLAERYPGTKFVKIVSTDCIPNYPDSNLPTLLVYFNGAVKATLVGLVRFGGRNASPEDVAFGLNQLGPVCQGGDDNGTDTGSASATRAYVERLIARREQEADDELDD
eukprot:jgi/Chlat1/1404/Chrsp12S01976